MPAPSPFLSRLKELDQQIDNLSLALSVASVGAWLWEVDRNRLHWDDTMFELYGRTRSKWSPEYGGFLACLHPDDHDRIAAQVARCVRDSDWYRADFRVIDESGAERNIFAFGSVKQTEAGKVMAGICLPLNERDNQEVRKAR